MAGLWYSLRALRAQLVPAASKHAPPVLLDCAHLDPQQRSRSAPTNTVIALSGRSVTARVNDGNRGWRRIARSHAVDD